MIGTAVTFLRVLASFIFASCRARERTISERTESITIRTEELGATRTVGCRGNCRRHRDRQRHFSGAEGDDAARRVAGNGVRGVGFRRLALACSARLTYAELAAALPEAGGEYVYLARGIRTVLRLSLWLDANVGRQERFDRDAGDRVFLLPGQLLSRPGATSHR